MWNALLSVSLKNSEHFWEEDGKLLTFSIQEDFEINQESNFHTISSLADVRGSSPDLVELELIRPCKMWKILYIIRKPNPIIIENICDKFAYPGT